MINTYNSKWFSRLCKKATKEIKKLNKKLEKCLTKVINNDIIRV